MKIALYMFNIKVLINTCTCIYQIFINILNHLYRTAIFSEKLQTGMSDKKVHAYSSSARPESLIKIVFILPLAWVYVFELAVTHKCISQRAPGVLTKIKFNIRQEHVGDTLEIRYMRFCTRLGAR